MEPEEIRGVLEELQSKLAAALTYCHNPKHYQERLLEGALENVLLLKRRLCAPSMVSCVERALEKPEVSETIEGYVLSARIGDTGSIDWITIVAHGSQREIALRDIVAVTVVAQEERALEKPVLTVVNADDTLLGGA